MSTPSICRQDSPTAQVSLGKDFAELRASRGHIQAYAQALLGALPNPTVRCALSSNNVRYIGLAGPTTDIATDVSYLIRNPLGCDALDATIGFSTTLNAPLAVDGFIRAKGRIAAAEDVGYAEGAQVAKVDAARCVVQAVGGTSYIGVRGLALACVIKKVDTTPAAPTLLGRITNVVSAVGGAIWGFFYLLLAVVCAMEIRNASNFRTELLTTMKDKDLVERVRFLEKYTGVEEVIATDKEKRNEALSNRIKAIKAAIKDTLTEKEYRAIAMEMLAMEAAAEEDPASYLSTYLELEGAALLQQKAAARSELKLSNLVGGAMAQKFLAVKNDLIHEGELLSKRVAEGDKEAIQKAKDLLGMIDPLVTEMEGALDKSILMNAGYMVACIVGIVATVLGFIALGPLGPIIIMAAFVIVTVLMTVLDGYRLHQSLKDVAPGKYDTTMLKISTAVGALSCAAGIVLASVLSLGIVPLLGAIAIGLIWLSVNAKSWHAVNAHQKRALGLEGRVVPLPQFDTNQALASVV